MSRSRTASDSRPALSESDSLELNVEAAMKEIHHLSFQKTLALKRAWESWNVKKNEKHAIFYQSISFCMQGKSFKMESDDIFSYIDKLKEELNQSSGEKRLFDYSNDDITQYLEQEISAVSREFPKEWTVIQLCKNFNPRAMYSTFEQISTYCTSISMTVFKHSAIKDMVLLELESPSDTNIYEKVYTLDRKIKEALNFKTAPKDTPAELQESKERYWKAKKNLEIHVQEIVNQLKSFVGSWIGVLTGNFKNRKSIETENEIRKKIYEFLSTRTFSESQEKLIHLLARRTDLLTHEQIFVAITYILRDKANLGYHDVDLNDLYDLLTWIKQEYVYEDVACHPCILIVDDYLDQMPFEMINTQQEFTRVCSFSNLKRLFERYRGSMDNGYLLTPTANCQALVNPDETLKTMSSRMQSFFNYWLQSPVTWKVVSDKKPSTEEFADCLVQSDAFVYCGHGSGLQFGINNLYNLKTKAVVFLYGCGSVQLSTTGLLAPMTGSHVYYHMGWSPAVVGFLWTVTDFDTDFCSSKILSGWCNRSQTKAHWQTIDRPIWKKSGSLVFTKSSADVVSSDYLSEIIMKIRSDSDIPISIKSSLVYRGLPVVNCTNK